MIARLLSTSTAVGGIGETTILECGQTDWTALSLCMSVLK